MSDLPHDVSIIFGLKTSEGEIVQTYYKYAMHSGVANKQSWLCKSGEVDAEGKCVDVESWRRSRESEFIDVCCEDGTSWWFVAKQSWVKTTFWTNQRSAFLPLWSVFVFWQQRPQTGNWRNCVSFLGGWKQNQTVWKFSPPFCWIDWRIQNQDSSESYNMSVDQFLSLLVSTAQPASETLFLVKRRFSLWRRSETKYLTSEKI